MRTTGISRSPICRQAVYTGGTRVRTASDFKGVRGRDALPEVYRQGRVGGVPVLGDLREVMEAWHAQEA